MKKVISVMALVIFCSCNETKPLEPFKLVINDYDYAMAYSREFVLTEESLNIVFKGELEGEKDSVIFSTALKPTEDLRILSTFDFNSLNDRYKNFCVDDGSQILVSYTKDNKTKDIHLSNFYQKDIGFVIGVVNEVVPKKYEIYYDKDELLELQKGCNE